MYKPVHLGIPFVSRIINEIKLAIYINTVRPNVREIKQFFDFCLFFSYHTHNISICKFKWESIITKTDRVSKNDILPTVGIQTLLNLTLNDFLAKIQIPPVAIGTILANCCHQYFGKVGRQH